MVFKVTKDVNILRNIRKRASKARGRIMTAAEASEKPDRPSANEINLETGSYKSAELFNQPKRASSLQAKPKFRKIDESETRGETKSINSLKAEPRKQSVSNITSGSGLKTPTFKALDLHDLPKTHKKRIKKKNSKINDSVNDLVKRLNSLSLKPEKQPDYTLVLDCKLCTKPVPKKASSVPGSPSNRSPPASTTHLISEAKSKKNIEIDWSLETNTKLPCNHHFHKKCLEEYVEVHGYHCPTCGSDFPKDVISGPKEKRFRSSTLSSTGGTYAQSKEPVKRSNSG